MSTADAAAAAAAADAAAAAAAAAAADVICMYNASAATFNWRVTVPVDTSATVMLPLQGVCACVLNRVCKLVTCTVCVCVRVMYRSCVCACYAAGTDSLTIPPPSLCRW